MLLYPSGGRLYRAVVKTTQDGSENYLLSFHRYTKKKALRAVRKLPPIFGDMADIPDDEDQGDGN
ncbi:hypothetical protein JCM25156A_24270 [Komagataeibacter kakiaceti JCM 25156]